MKLLTKKISHVYLLVSSRPPGYADDVLSAAASMDLLAGTYQITQENWDRFIVKYRRRGKPFGPGGHLKKLLAYMGVHESATCRCNFYAGEMDRRGIQWCKDNAPVIVRWLTEEVEKQKAVATGPARMKLDFYSEEFGREIVMKAIELAEEATAATSPEKLPP